MKRSIKIAIITVLILTAILCLTACDGLFSIRDNGGTGTKGDINITLDLQGGKGVEPADFINGKKLVKPASDPTRDGYLFDGYYYDNEYKDPITFNVTIDKDIKIVAKWKAAATFIYGSWKDSAIVAESEGKYVAPTDTARAGYTFEGWFADSSFNTAADFEQDAVAGAKFYAKYEAISYAITYQMDGIASVGVNAKTTYTVEEQITLESPVGIQSGYDFIRWIDENNNTVTNIPRGSSGNRVFTAVFLSHNNFITAITGGTVGDSAASTGVSYSVSSYDIIGSITVSPRATFVVKQGIETVTGNVDLTEGNNVFTVEVTSENNEKKTYTVTVTRYGEGQATVTFHYPTSPSETTINVPVNKGNTVTAHTPHEEIEGYEFDNWYTTDAYSQVFNFSTTIGADTDIYAKYNPIEYSITYYSGIGTNSGANYAAYNIETGFALTNATAPDGYTSAGWYDGSNNHVTAITVGTTGNKVLYARYTVTTANDALSGSYLLTGQSIAKADLLDYFNWAIAQRATELNFTITDDTFNLNSDMPDLNSVSVPTSFLVVSYSAIGKNVTANFTYSTPANRASETDAFTQMDYYGHDDYTKVRSNDFDNFKINSIQSTYPATISDQLIYIVESGYRPVPTADSAAERIYNAAKEVLRDIVDDSMTDMEKAHAIYDWLVLNVIYDEDLLDVTATLTAERNALVVEYNNASTDEEKKSIKNQINAKDAELKSYNGFYLEGVFDDYRAVCDGISKAFVLMCRIEGIECVQVTGKVWATDSYGNFILDHGEKVEGSGHAWNKVKIGGNWYVVDPTHGSPQISGNEVITHGCFLITDAQRAITAKASDHTDLVANTAYDVYNDMTFIYLGEEYDMVIESRAELIIVMRYFKQLVNEQGANQTFDVRMDYDYESISDEIQAAVNATSWSVNPSGGANRGDVLILIKYA